MGTFQKSRDRTVACSRQSGRERQTQPLPWQRADKGEHAWDLSPGALHVYKVDVYIWSHHAHTLLQSEKRAFLALNSSALPVSGWDSVLPCHLRCGQLCPGIWEPCKDTLGFHGHSTSPTKQSSSQGIKDLCWLNQANFRLSFPPDAGEQ